MGLSRYEEVVGEGGGYTRNKRVCVGQRMGVSGVLTFFYFLRIFFVWYRAFQK